MKKLSVLFAFALFVLLTYTQSAQASLDSIAQTVSTAEKYYDNGMKAINAENENGALSAFNSCLNYCDQAYTELGKLSKNVKNGDGDTIGFIIDNVDQVCYMQAIAYVSTASIYDVKNMTGKANENYRKAKEVCQKMLAFYKDADDSENVDRWTQIYNGVLEIIIGS